VSRGFASRDEAYGNPFTSSRNRLAGFNSELDDIRFGIYEKRKNVKSSLSGSIEQNIRMATSGSAFEKADAATNAGVLGDTVDRQVTLLREINALEQRGVEIAKQRRNVITETNRERLESIRTVRDEARAEADRLVDQNLDARDRIGGMGRGTQNRILRVFRKGRDKGPESLSRRDAELLSSLGIDAASDMARQSNLSRFRKAGLGELLTDNDEQRRKAEKSQLSLDTVLARLEQQFEKTFQGATKQVDSFAESLDKTTEKIDVLGNVIDRLSKSNQTNEKRNPNFIQEGFRQ
jgi:hypothetical protein